MKGVILFVFLATLASVCVSEKTPLIGAKHVVEPASIEHWVDILREEHGLNVSAKYVIHNPRIQVVNGILYDFFLEDEESDTLHHIVFVSHPWKTGKEQRVQILKQVEIAKQVSKMNKNKLEELMKEHEDEHENPHEQELIDDLEQDQVHEDEHENQQEHESEPVENELEELEELGEPAEEVESA